MTEIRYETCEGVEPLIGARTIALLPMGSTEPHGPHLPLDTDVRIAEAVARETSRQLDARGGASLVLPALPYGITRLAQGFAGGVTLRPGTLWALVEDLVLSLQQDGIRQLVLCNAHHEWEHTRVLSNLTIDFCERGPGRCQVLFPRAAPSLRLSETECHGGRRETSLMLAIAPECVRADALSDLPPVPIELPAAQAGTNRSLLDLGAARAYCGSPAQAQREEGVQILHDWAADLAETCRQAWPDLFDEPGS